MKLVAWLLIALVIAFVGASVADRCAEGESGDCPPACHLACLDGCSLAPVESHPPALVALALVTYRQFDNAFTPLTLDYPPDLFPPRA